MKRVNRCSWLMDRHSAVSPNLKWALFGLEAALIGTAVGIMVGILTALLRGQPGFFTTQEYAYIFCLLGAIEAVIASAAKGSKAVFESFFGSALVFAPFTLFGQQGFWPASNWFTSCLQIVLSSAAFIILLALTMLLFPEEKRM